MTNSGYDGPLPGLEYYDPDGMKEPARSELICWYEENKDSRHVLIIQNKNTSHLKTKK